MRVRREQVDRENNRNLTAVNYLETAEREMSRSGRGWWPRRVVLSRSSELLDPSDDLRVPLDLVLRVEHLMRLVGEVEELGRDAATLQRREAAQSLRLVDAVVATALRAARRNSRDQRETT